MILKNGRLLNESKFSDAENVINYDSLSRLNFRRYQPDIRLFWCILQNPNRASHQRFNQIYASKKLSVTKTEHVEGKKATRMRKIDYVPEPVTRKEYSFHYHYSIRGRGNKDRNLR